MANRSLTKKFLSGICVVWMAWAGWDQFANIPDTEIENHSSAAVQDRMRDCTGTFKQRYECKENIVIKSGRSTFNNMLERLAIVGIPPILLMSAYHMMTRRRQDDYDYDDSVNQEHHRRHRRRSTHR
ncbi:conserved hypothetical protein [Candidatus Terasakiella magnetica]|nr:conserved hypothetical protein [Candidatus Terasakiella magnetica]